MKVLYEDGPLIIEWMARCTPEGAVKLNPDLFDLMTTDIQADIEELDGPEALKATLRLADFCADTGMEQEAVDLYRQVLYHTACNKETATAPTDLSLEAYDGLSRLANSGDDYVWESVTALLEDYRYLTEEDGTDKR